MSQIIWKVGDDAYLKVNFKIEYRDFGYSNLPVYVVNEYTLYGTGDCYDDSNDNPITPSTQLNDSFWEYCVSRYTIYDYSGVEMDKPYVLGDSWLYYSPVIWGANNNERPIWDYSQLSEATVEDGITSIGPDLFKVIMKNKSLFTDDSQPRLGNNIYRYSNYDLAKTVHFDVTIKGRVKSIGQYAFALISESSEVGNTIKFNTGALKKIKNGAFKGCYYTSKIELGNCTLTSLGARAFMDCRHIDDLKINDINCYIPYECFKDCTLLNRFAIDNYINTELCEESFYRCDHIDRIKIGNNASLSNNLPITNVFFVRNGSSTLVNPDQDGNLITILDTTNTDFLDVEAWLEANRNIDYHPHEVWYIADQGRWLAFNPQTVPDNNRVLMKHNGQGINFKYVLPNDPKASNVYTKHNGIWMCLVNN